ncbi:MAG TPA: hypothetical protein VKG92_03980 [Flavobacteriales bacterium]|nr:hypothetical protein [Flavobacteriales bacterium]
MTAKQRLEATLWDIANTLRGKMSADDFRDYIAVAVDGRNTQVVRTGFLPLVCAVGTKVQSPYSQELMTKAA